MSGNLVGIARVWVLGAPLEELTSTAISVQRGIEGDARGEKRGRQVTVLFRDGWEDACREVGAELPWITRRANLLLARAKREACCASATRNCRSRWKRVPAI